MIDIFNEILKERERQDTLFPNQMHADFYWFLILSEEVGEVSRELLGLDKVDSKKLEAELIQCAAVIVAWLEDRRNRNEFK